MQSLGLTLKRNKQKIILPNQLILFGKKTILLDIVITPLLAFDPHGYRVGYGKGFYDRFFASLHKDAKRIGISSF